MKRDEFKSQRFTEAMNFFDNFKASDIARQRSSIANKTTQLIDGQPLIFQRRPLNKYKPASIASDLPKHETRHWRGLWIPKENRLLGRFAADDEFLPLAQPESRKTRFVPPPETILCHSKPSGDSSIVVGSESRFPDIPDRLDIYFLLRHQFHAIAFNGKRIGAVIRRTQKTNTKINQLHAWENERSTGKYRKTRARAQFRNRKGFEPPELELERIVAVSALRYLGLKWPGKPNERKKRWVKNLEILGLTVEVIENKSSSNRAYGFPG